MTVRLIVNSEKSSRDVWAVIQDFSFESRFWCPSHPTQAYDLGKPLLLGFVSSVLCREVTYFTHWLQCYKGVKCLRALGCYEILLLIVHVTDTLTFIRGQFEVAF